LLTFIQGRARPSRRIVGYPRIMDQIDTNPLQVDSDDEDDDSGSDQPRKRQRTASRKGLHIPQIFSTTLLTCLLSLESTDTCLPRSRLRFRIGWLCKCQKEHPD
jgi:hypothetical protein